MKIRKQDRDYVSFERLGNNIAKRYKVGYFTYYGMPIKTVYKDDKGISQVKHEFKDTYEVLDNGLCKCKKCYSLMIPVIDEEGTVIFYNLDNEKIHYITNKRPNPYNRKYKRRTGVEWLCSI
jgi:hypothetical protein